MNSRSETDIAMVPAPALKVLQKRGMDEEAIRRFVFPSYVDHLYDPYLLTGMDHAIDRIELAAKEQETVVVYGDYDIDGLTASAIMIEGLAAVGVVATSYIPDRFEEGYGINQEALESLQKSGATLVISVDCGITSVKEAQWAKSHGLDLIITDHHNPPPQLPEAIAVINPKKSGDTYPFKELCGAGVAFKVIQALQLRVGHPKPGQEKWLLDLVALGTVCDVVPLIDENRVLASYGLKVLRQTRRVGLVALAAVAGVKMDEVTAYHLGYVLGPRMNAAGRLEHASQALALLQTKDVAEATQIAGELDALNLRRRQEQAEVFEQAQHIAADFSDDPVLVLADKGWSHGIVGIVASKLVEEFGKPVLVAQILGEFTKGSARSIGSFNMVEALRANEQLLTKFGGHFFAAGCTFPSENLELLRQGLGEYFRSAGATGRPQASLDPDLVVERLAEADWDLVAALDLLEPYGAGNAAPMLAFPRTVVDRPGVIGAGGKHLRLQLKDEANSRLAAIAFGLGPRSSEYHDGTKVTAYGRLSRNEYMGKTSLQVIVQELRHE